MCSDVMSKGSTFTRENAEIEQKDEIRGKRRAECISVRD